MYPSTPHIIVTWTLRAPLWLLVLAAVSAGCERQAPPSMSDVRAEVGPTQESWDVGFRISETDEGDDASRPRLFIQAGYMATYETDDSTYTLMQGARDTTGAPVTLFVFDAEGDTSATVRASRVYYYDNESRFEALGHVVVDARGGRRLESEQLTWKERDRQIRTPGFARITTPDERIQGYDLVASEDLSTYGLSRVTGQVTIDEGS